VCQRRIRRPRHWRNQTPPSGRWVPPIFDLAGAGAPALDGEMLINLTFTTRCADGTPREPGRPGQTALTSILRADGAAVCHSGKQPPDNQAKQSIATPDSQPRRNYRGSNTKSTSEGRAGK